MRRLMALGVLALTTVAPACGHETPGGPSPNSLAVTHPALGEVWAFGEQRNIEFVVFIQDAKNLNQYVSVDITHADGQASGITDRMFPRDAKMPVPLQVGVPAQEALVWQVGTIQPGFDPRIPTTLEPGVYTLRVCVAPTFQGNEQTNGVCGSSRAFRIAPAQ